MGYTYTEYLHLPRLLDLQEPRAVPAVHDELLFVTMHQTCELWFRQILVELEDARDRMLAGEVVLPTRRLARCRAIEALLVHQFDVLDTMPAQEFARFRDVLGDGNGGQSAQYAEILMLSGAKEAREAAVPGTPSRNGSGCGGARTSRRSGTASWPRWRARAGRLTTGPAGRRRWRPAPRSTPRCGCSHKPCSSTTRAGRCGRRGTC